MQFTIDLTANLYSLYKENYHCATDLLFDWFGFNQTSKFAHKFNVTKLLNQNQSNQSETSPDKVSDYIFSALVPILIVCVPLNYFDGSFVTLNAAICSAKIGRPTHTPLNVEVQKMRSACSV